MWKIYRGWKTCMYYVHLASQLPYMISCQMLLLFIIELAAPYTSAARIYYSYLFSL